MFDCSYILVFPGISFQIQSTVAQKYDINAGIIISGQLATSRDFTVTQVHTKNLNKLVTKRQRKWAIH